MNYSISNDTFTIEGKQYRLVEKGMSYKYIYKALGTQVNVRSIVEIRRIMNKPFWERVKADIVKTIVDNTKPIQSVGGDSGNSCNNPINQQQQHVKSNTN